MSAGEKRSCAICVVERTGQGSCRRQVRQNARIVRYGATQPWHCQGLLAGNTRMPPSSGTARFIWQKPPSSGTARKNWQESPVRHPALALPVFFWLSVFFRHSGLALPKIIGVERPRATQDWHCQGILAPWLPYVLASPTSHSANCNAACANCNENPIAMPVQ